MTSHTVQDLYIILFFCLFLSKNTIFNGKRHIYINSQKKLSHVGYFARYTK